MQYGQWARTNSDRGESIQRRHRYYSARMVEFLGNLTPKDPNRFIVRGFVISYEGISWSVRLHVPSLGSVLDRERVVWNSDGILTLRNSVGNGEA